MKFFKTTLFFLLPFFLVPSAFTQQYFFSAWSIEQGLSQSVVNCIFQDSKGYIWVGTQHGLNKFNGSTFEIFTYNPKDSGSIPNNWIYSVDEDKNGNLWIVTKNGLSQFIRNGKRFHRMRLNSGFQKNIQDFAYDAIISRKGKLIINMTPVLAFYDPETKKCTYYNSRMEYDGSVKDNQIPLLEDASGLIWMGSTKGLACFDPETGKFTQYLHQPENPNTISNNNITALLEDKNSNIWIGTAIGLNVLNKSDGNIKRFCHQPGNPFSLSNNFIRAITEDRSGNIWIGTEGGGLNKLTGPMTGSPVFEAFTSERNGLSHNIVNALFIDKSENLWIGTLQGISKTDLKKPKFQLYRKSGSPYSVNLLGNVIAAIYKDDDGKIWVGNWGQGLNIIDRKTGKVEHFSSQLDKNHHLENDFVHVIFQDAEKRIWIGTRDGIFIYKKENNSFVPLNIFFRNLSLPDLRGFRINKIIQDKKRNYWVATQHGLIWFDLLNGVTRRFTIHSADNQKLSGNLVYSILEDHLGLIWISTSNGLDVYNPATATMAHFQKVEGSPNSISDNYVISLCEDHRGDIWIGTGSGVNKFDRNDSSFISYSHENGFPDDQIFDIVEDENHTLWFTTGRGLFRFDLSTGSVRTYTVEEGLQSLEFNLRAAFKSKDGEIFFGGMQGFNSFYPDSLNDNQYLPEVVIATFSKTGLDGKKEITDTENMDEIVLNHNENSFTLEFASLEFTYPDKNKFAYRMKGISDEWMDIGTRKFVPFTNLPPGEYIFTVKGTNNDGVWGKASRDLKIIVHPPWWKSNPAYLAYALLIILSVVFYIKWRISKLLKERNRLEENVRIRTLQIEKQKDELIKSREKLDVMNRELEQRVQERTAEYLLAKEKAESGDRLKTAFMHNISHEIRTPLNGILGFGQLMLQEDVTPDEREQFFDVLQKSSERLMNTVTDYMDISLLASGNMEICKKQFHPTDVLNDIYHQYFKSCQLKNLSLTVHPPAGSESLSLYSDYELVSKVLDHLVDNAVKFTHQGSISFGYELGAGFVEFFVRDTGIGIAPENQDFIFQNFAQADPSLSRAHEGSGLGLSIARGILNLLGGTIRVVSTRNEGACFYFTVPVEIPGNSPVTVSVAQAVQTNRPLILIAEDEESNSMLLSQILQNKNLDYLVVSDGKQAVDACRENPKISLVLMDIKMPRMNGYEATRNIKSFAPLLPVIAITAYAMSGDKKKAFDAGCDDYLPKPIEIEILMEKLKKFGIGT